MAQRGRRTPSCNSTVLAETKVFEAFCLLQALALDALAAWLEEDAGRLQPRLAQRDTLARLTALLAAHTPAGAQYRL